MITRDKTHEVELEDINSLNITTKLKDYVLRILRNEGLYKPSHVYRGFRKANIPSVLRLGSEDVSKNRFYGNFESKLANEHWTFDPLGLMLVPPDAGALAAYNAEDLAQMGEMEFEFRDLERRTEALIKIFYFNEFPVKLLY